MQVRVTEDMTYLCRNPLAYESFAGNSDLGEKVKYRSGNSLLRCFQSSPGKRSDGRFAGIRIARLPRELFNCGMRTSARDVSCKFIVMPGMEITEMSQELKCVPGAPPWGQQRRRCGGPPVDVLSSQLTDYSVDSKREIRDWIRTAD